MARYRPAAIMTCWAPVSAGAIAASTDLAIVAQAGVGLDNIAVAAATPRGIWVSNVPDCCVEEVSDHAVAMWLAWARGLVRFDRAVEAGSWNPAGARLSRVRELTVGLVGHGRIAHMTARKLVGFGVTLVAHAAHPRANEGGARLSLSTSC
jgi:D-3-phosphoglycerate dehydrogenase / 2-oxoglutarate reductase